MTLLDIRTQIGCTQKAMAERMGLSRRTYNRAEQSNKRVYVLAAQWVQFMADAPRLNDAYSAERSAYRDAHPVVDSRDV